MNSDENNLGEYYICAQFTQTKKAQSMIQKAQDYAKENSLEKPVSDKVSVTIHSLCLPNFFQLFTKVFIKGSMNCVS
jgi:hypothetical protein